MKSIRDWRDEKYLKSTGIDPNALRVISEDISDVAMRQVMGGNLTKIDTNLRMQLRPKLIQIIKDHPDDRPVDILRQIIAISGQLLGDMTGSTLSTTKLSDLGDME